ncbi:MAG: formylmethanofuran dehydrogenase subunit E family protein [Candidatus Omnitrophica bacterium]|nr:formylmethanofuran dehydrogenase subunit E family protein [Candidatus Omnitrophota bacterium]
MNSLIQAKKFHGHLGPWLILGLLMGRYALKKLKAKKYFGIEVKVWGANKRPESCLIDGLQLSTGATYGKGNIIKLKGPLIKIEFINRKDNKKIILGLKDSLIQTLKKIKTTQDAELLAKKIYRRDYSWLFKTIT